MRTILLAVLLCFSLSVKANDQNIVSSNQDSITVKSAVFDPEVATQNYLDMLTSDQKEKSDSYFEGGYWLMLWTFLYEFVIVWIFLSLGLSNWIKRIATKVKNINLQNLIYIGFYFLFVYLLTFPLTIYQDYFREHQYNLSNLTFGGWFGEEMKGLALSIIFGSLILMLIYIAIRKVKQQWWKWASGISMVFVVIGMYIGPVFISPIFNDYKPLEDGKIKDEILSIARANGVPADNVYQFDASKQSTRISANVSGIGSTIRISLNDNLLNKCSLAEIKSVMAHEIGHYVLNHIYKSIFLIIIIIMIGFAFVNWSLNWAINKWGSKWNISGITDIAALPLFIFFFSAYFFFASPILNNIIRVNEIEADYFGLNAAQEPDGFASVSMKLSEYRKINPGHLEEIIFYDHPSGRVRVHNAMIWKAEHIKETLLEATGKEDK